MSNHGLTRNPDNEPVCLCGLRHGILDDIRYPWHERQCKAKKVILDHAEALNTTPTPLRSPDAPFQIGDAVYPRAGVRRTPAGKWLLTLWDGPGIMHHIDEPEFDARTEAFDYGWVTVGACRQSGTNLNGWAAA